MAILFDWYENPKTKDKQGEELTLHPRIKLNGSTTTDELRRHIQTRFAQSRKILDVREKYYNEFRKFLSPKQIQKMYNMEKHNGDKFRKEMRKRQGMKKQHDGRRHMPQGDVKK